MYLTQSNIYVPNIVIVTKAWLDDYNNMPSSSRYTEYELNVYKSTFQVLLRDLEDVSEKKTYYGIKDEIKELLKQLKDLSVALCQRI